MTSPSILTRAAGLALFLAAAGLPASSGSGATSPEGRWKTVDDHTGKARSVVKIGSENGRLTGQIERLFREKGEDPDPHCKKCDHERKDQRVIGMKILWDLVSDGEGWGSGYILDPENGKTYRCQIKLLAGGEKLEVRGYIGMPLLGRSQVWERWADPGP
jgi:uncharacterized protein (DUF2147 family)